MTCFTCFRPLDASSRHYLQINQRHGGGAKCLRNHQQENLRRGAGSQPSGLFLFPGGVFRKKASGAITHGCFLPSRQQQRQQQPLLAVNVDLQCAYFQLVPLPPPFFVSLYAGATYHSVSTQIGGICMHIRSIVPFSFAVAYSPQSQECTYTPPPPPPP